MKRFYFLLKVVMTGFLLTGFGSVPGFAYEMGETLHGGSLTGKVKLRGPVPENRTFPIALYEYGVYCKKISDGNGHVLLKEFHVDLEGGLQDVVIAIQDVKRGKPFRYIKNEFVAVNCMFHPYDVADAEQFETHEGTLTHVHPLVMILRNDSPLAVLNRDPIVHNGQVYQPEKGNVILNFPIPVADNRHGGSLHFEEGMKIAQMICGMHEYMQTWGWIVDNPYYAKTGKDGKYMIDRIPPGSYHVTAWHPHMKPVEKEIVIPPQGAVDLDFEFESQEVERPLYETQEQFRIGPGYRPKEDLMGCEGPYCVHRHDH
ncbi:MAG: carboxypeptidase regulatory-like domain-containing protein [Nitrospirae bacterium]|nr:carboxypeptidase regulatory-like domain-containing protein [Nitrospirota bacterium]